MGLKHAQLEELLRDLLLSEARRLWEAKQVKNPNVSQLSTTTGLNRKEVTSRLRRPVDELPHTGLSSAARTFTLWFQLASQDESLLRLPITSTGGQLSFEAVARQASRGDVHHRSVLDELSRLGICQEEGTHVVLLSEGFVPTGDLRSSLAFLGDNVRDHLAAAVSNTLVEGKPFLERSVFADGLTLQDCESIHQMARQRWTGLHRDFVKTMTEAVDRGQGQGDKRLRMGVYVYYEDARDELTEGAEPPKTAE